MPALSVRRIRKLVFPFRSKLPSTSRPFPLLVMAVVPLLCKRVPLVLVGPLLRRMTSVEEPMTSL